MKKYFIQIALGLGLSLASQAQTQGFKEDQWAQDYIQNSPLQKAIRETVRAEEFRRQLQKEMPYLSPYEAAKVAKLLGQAPANQLIMDVSKMKLMGYYTATEVEVMARKLNTVVPFYTKSDRTGFTFYAAALSDGRYRTDLRDVIGVVTHLNSISNSEKRFGTIYIFKF